MQLFVHEEVLARLRASGRRAGTVPCARTPYGTLFAVDTDDDPAELYNEFASLRDALERIRLPWIAAPLPTQPSPWILRAAIPPWDSFDEFVDRAIKKANRLPHLAPGYQPFMEHLLTRGTNGLLVLDGDGELFLRARRRHGLPSCRWIRAPMNTVPVGFPTDGQSPHIAGRRFVLIGAGSLGSRIAELLAAAGATELVVVDPDILEPRNLRRHLCGRRHLGRPKAEAVADELAARGFPTQVRPIVGRAQVEVADELRTRIAGADGVICAADMSAPRHFANHCAVHAQVPSVITDVQLRPEPLGEIVVAVPSNGGCFNCWRIELEESGLMGQADQHDEADYPAPSEVAPSGLPMYQLTLVASASCDLLAEAVATGSRSLKWLMAIDKAVSDFPSLAKPKEITLEALDQHPNCEVCR